MILYLHGFRSGPASHKAQLLGSRMAELGLRFDCPQLPVEPRTAIALCEERIVASTTQVTLVGSSLGGYYATFLAERHGLKAVLVNPVVHAHLALLDQIGPQTNLFSGEPFEFTAGHIAALHALEVPQISKPERYWLLAERGDELLDCREAVAKFTGAHQTVLAGGDHSFTRWPDYLDDIIRFAGEIVPPI